MVKRPILCWAFFLACLSALMCKLPISLRVVVIVKLVQRDMIFVGQTVTVN